MWLDMISSAVNNITTGTVRYMYDVFPSAVLAVLFIIVGYFIGVVFGWVVRKLVESTRIDEWIEEQNLSHAIGGHTIAVVLGTIVKWLIFAVFLTQAAASLNFAVLKDLLIVIGEFVVNLIKVAIIVILGLLFARYVRNFIEVTTLKFRKTLAIATELIIIYLSVIIGFGSTVSPHFPNGLVNVAILENIFMVAFTAIVFTAAIVIGISFGLALKDEAKSLVKDFEKTTVPKKKRR